MFFFDFFSALKHIFKFFFEVIFVTEALLKMSLAHAAQELGSSLSSAARITFPDGQLYTNVTARWSDYKAPQLGVVVTVASEPDIKQTVCFLVTTA